MSKTLDQLYDVVLENIRLDPALQERLGALAEARGALLEELDRLCGAKAVPLLDAVNALEAESESLHDRALFSAALELGMELGRLPVS